MRNAAFQKHRWVSIIESGRRQISRSRHPLVERSHLTLLHMAPSQHRLVERVPLPFPLSAAQSAKSRLDDASNLHPGDRAQASSATARADLVYGLAVQSGGFHITHIPPPLALTSRIRGVCGAAVVLHSQAAAYHRHLSFRGCQALLNGPVQA